MLSRILQTYDWHFYFVISGDNNEDDDDDDESIINIKLSAHFLL
jgi:hypothetical protein